VREGERKKREGKGSVRMKEEGRGGMETEGKEVEGEVQGREDPE